MRLRIFPILITLMGLSVFMTSSQKHADRSIAEERDLSWWAASTSEVENAACKTKAVPSLEEMNELIQKFAGTDRVFGYVHGAIIWSDSPVLIQALQTLTTRTPKYGGTWGEVLERQVNLRNDYSIRPMECSKVQCILEKIWGSEMATKILWILLKHGFNTSELAFDSASRFERDELDDVIKALEDLPQEVVKITYEGNQRLAPIDRMAPTTMTIADSAITLMKPWRASSSFDRQLSLFHEFGHIIEKRLLSNAQWIEWQYLTTWAPAEEACWVSRYAKQSAGEAFAEAVTAYRYAPWRLKEICPSQYDYLKKHVFRAEYLDESSCGA